MIFVPISDLWVLLAIWLAVVFCAFMLGWHGGNYTRSWPETAPEPAPAPPPLPRRGRLPVRPAEQTAIDIQRWWPGMERTAGPSTTPLSAVQLSNWEVNKRLAMDAWLHERGMRP
jgi:hypothetical protein